MPNNYDVLRDAIVNKLQIVATYHGFAREMCPHALGMKNGRQQVLCYQFGGGSSSGVIVPGSPKNWRCMEVAALTAVVSRAGAWHSGDNHSRPQTCIDTIDVEVRI